MIRSSDRVRRIQLRHLPQIGGVITGGHKRAVDGFDVFYTQVIDVIGQVVVLPEIQTGPVGHIEGKEMPNGLEITIIRIPVLFVF